MAKAKVTKSADPSPAVVSIDVTTGTATWRKKGARYYAFSAQDEHGKQGVIERTLEGTVTNSYLRAGAMSHSISIEVDLKDLEDLKSLIKTAPGFDAKAYRWPFKGTVVRLNSRKDLSSEYKCVWNGVGIDWTDVDQRKRITADKVKHGRSVIVEYTPVPYDGKEADDESDGFEGGCSLQLLSIGVLDDDGSEKFDFDSPQKRRRMAD